MWRTPALHLPGPSRGLITTGRDLVRLGTAVLRAPEMLRHQGATVTAAAGGLGTLTGRHAGRPVVFQDGGVRDAYSAVLIVDPERGVVSAATANGHPARLWEVLESWRPEP